MHWFIVPIPVKMDRSTVCAVAMVHCTNHCSRRQNKLKSEIFAQLILAKVEGLGSQIVYLNFI